jgi:hypothetical protein
MRLACSLTHHWRAHLRTERPEGCSHLDWWPRSSSRHGVRQQPYQQRCAAQQRRDNWQWRHAGRWVPAAGSSSSPAACSQRIPSRMSSQLARVAGSGRLLKVERAAEWLGMQCLMSGTGDVDQLHGMGVSRTRHKTRRGHTRRSHITLKHPLGGMARHPWACTAAASADGYAPIIACNNSFKQLLCADDAAPRLKTSDFIETLRVDHRCKALHVKFVGTSAARDISMQYQVMLRHEATSQRRERRIADSIATVSWPETLMRGEV